ncbi:thiamine diphosphokinase [Bifidobacterium sp. ESL0728]|uniref:thiamine diphosphokinase n=1 Tax=Bifidobacterium sp. ESL0728 TaxID=2983220 RepID=UPI0023F78613|nr:thiamine diphosphokinase [Bifidobacterium sp. ESL0728]WEV58491.1 thiamine diphosphokinase [Bifidobacterium sp. ESL0728]
MSEICVVFAAGAYYGNEPSANKLPANAFVIAADGGLDHVRGLGIRPNLAIGDFDSTNVDVPQGVETIALPPEHDDPDMLSALKTGWSRGYRDFRIYGGLGGRIDHTIANIQMLALLAHNGGHGLLYGAHSVVTAICNGSLHFPASTMQADADEAKTKVMKTDLNNQSTKNTISHGSHGSGTVDGTSANAVNRMVSVFSHADVSHGVNETGLKYELKNGTMHSDTVLGVSNELLDGRPASISVADGTLIVSFPIEAALPAFKTNVKASQTLGPLASHVSALLNKSR